MRNAAATNASIWSLCHALPRRSRCVVSLEHCAALQNLHWCVARRIDLTGWAQRQVHCLSVCLAGNAQALEAALKGARAVICTGRLGILLELPQSRKLEHLIVLSSAGGQHGMHVPHLAATSLANNAEAFAAKDACPTTSSGGESQQRNWAPPQCYWWSYDRCYGQRRLLPGCSAGWGGRRTAGPQEGSCSARGADPHTILRVGQIKDSPGGAQELLFSQVQQQPCPSWHDHLQGSLTWAAARAQLLSGLSTCRMVEELGRCSREDVARVSEWSACSGSRRTACIFSLESGRPAVPVELSRALAGLQETAPASVQR